jgi:hypothetical protein
MRLRNLLFLLLLVPIIVKGQTTSISPYSGFGLGEIAPQGYDLSFAMGGSGFGMYDSISINPLNPASYAKFKSNNPILQVGYKGQLLNVSSSVNSEQLKNGTINNLALGFKFGKKLGWVFGFNPATTIGYKIVVGQEFTDADGNKFPVKFQFEGDGGYSKIFTGFAYNIYEKRDSVLGQMSSFNVGVNINLITGNKRSLYDVVFDSGDFSYYNTRYEESQIITDFGFDIGLQYQTYLKKVSATDYINLSLGVSFNIPKNMNTQWKSHYYTYSLDALDVPFVRDTIFYRDNLTGSTFIPLRMGIGMMLDINSKLQILLDYEEQKWDDFKQNVNGFGEITDNLLNTSWRVSAGVQYSIVPVSQRKMNTNYLKMITLRLGGRYEDMYLNFENYDLIDKALSVGFNFPLSKSQSFSSINIGMEFGTQGTIDNGLIKQDYMNFMVGITLLPHRFNKWFLKRKYN